MAHTFGEPLVRSPLYKLRNISSRTKTGRAQASSPDMPALTIRPLAAAGQAPPLGSDGVLVFEVPTLPFLFPLYRLLLFLLLASPKPKTKSHK